jgi:hypothetical protein
MRAQERFLQLPPGYDPLVPRTVATNAFPGKRLIIVLRSDAKSDRYALHRFPDGSVWWRADTFTAPEDPAIPESWISYRGEMTVGEVIASVADQRRAVIDWTRDEIGRGAEIPGIEDPLVAERRVQSLRRLREELAAVSVAPSRRAA